MASFEANRCEARTVIIGVGNEFRGDDAVGLQVARLLRERAASDAVILEQSGEGTAVIEAMSGVQRLIIIDACLSGAAVGTIRRLDARAERLPAALFHHSSHAFGVAEAIETARALGQLPPEAIVYGVEGRNFGYGATMCDAVAAASEKLTNAIASQLCREVRF
jgi:hydrogenase maturation protease